MLNPRWTTIGIFVMICVIIVYVFMSRSEDFATRADKERASREWFASVEQPTYKAYKKALPESDIVEYESSRARFYKAT